LKKGRKRNKQQTTNKYKKFNSIRTKNKKKEIQEGVQYENKPASGSSNNFKNKN